MSNLNYKQVANVERRRWDVEAYEKKAAARAQRQEQGDEGPTTIDSDRRKRQDDVEKEEFQAAPEGAAGPEGSRRAFLKPRKEKVGDIDDRIGSTTMVSVEEAAAAGKANKDSADVVKKTGVGWHCTVCDCFLKDSHTYLDHINGRKHQRKLGYSMRVERSTESDLMNKLRQLTEKKKESDKEKDEEIAINYDNIVAAKDEEEQRRKEERKQKRKERKKLQKEKEENPAEEDEDDGEEDEAAIDPDMAAMMGFSGFGSSSKN